ncbi:hypothetical protein GIB67_005843, partial [Kingdonia uniflora]
MELLKEILERQELIACLEINDGGFIAARMVVIPHIDALFAETDAILVGMHFVLQLRDFPVLVKLVSKLLDFWNEKTLRCKESTIAVITHKIIETVRLRMVSFSMTTEGIVANSVSFDKWNLEPRLKVNAQIACWWVRPPEGAFAVNTDGTVIAACHGQVIAESILMHELQGISHGLQLSLDVGIQRLSLRSDSQEAVPSSEIFRSLNATIVGLAVSSIKSTESGPCSPWCIGLG